MQKYPHLKVAYKWNLRQLCVCLGAVFLSVLSGREGIIVSSVYE